MSVHDEYKYIDFYHRDAMLARVLAVMVCLSVCHTPEKKKEKTTAVKYKPVGIEIPCGLNSQTLRCFLKQVNIRRDRRES